ncbi:MAG: ATP-binding protein [Microcystis sp. M_QC_C_20170808_M2Col]|uniref:ATP-binding protein n=1 Tax=Microcystis sp. M_QC_C_20170808_M2Col TaxID=2486215 RepID=UPI001190561B|nr:ATP-binding protein [Microcystis sp. M_QC_C_20170808_M2Col]TRT64320.1 MAG: ATP-binding protein [Microcystis sp. M_QC_C_20170808_M2Col]
MNNIDQVLQYVDDLMFEKVASHLTPVQEAILTGVWQGQKYWQIAQSFNGCSESHIKKEAANLWKKLGKVLDEDVNKDNLRSKLERKYRVSQAYHSGNCLLQIDNINIGGQIIQTTNDNQNRSYSLHNNKSPMIDLTKAPELRYNYGRKLEISTLKEWLDNKTRLITIYGLSGIGKTALTLKLVSEIAPQFDYIIYRSLENIPQLIALKDDLKQQNIFKPGELAGKYLSDCQDYHKFFQQIATTSHQSCLILISWELPRDFVTLKSDKIKTLYLQGLTTEFEEIFKEYGLKNEEKWTKLSELYQGHPNWLNIISSTIIELFDGEVSLFLEQMKNEIYLGDMEDSIECHLQRLSATEKKVIHWLANQTEAVEKFPKTANLDLSTSEFWATIQSLIRRCLLDKLPSETSSYFPINPVFKSYLKRNPND